jgi:hypothetical protein
MATASRLAWRPHARQTGVPIRPTSNHLGGRAVVAGFVLRHKTTRMNRPARCSACRPVFAATKAEDGVGGCEIGSNGRGVSSRSSRSQPPRVPVVTTAAEQEEKHDRKHDKGCERHDCLQLNRGAISGPQVCRDDQDDDAVACSTVRRLQHSVNRGVSCAFASFCSSSSAPRRPRHVGVGTIMVVTAVTATIVMLSGDEAAVGRAWLGASARHRAQRHTQCERVAT